MFAVGDLVVCIDAKPKAGPIGAIVTIHHLIQEGRVYRVDFIGHTRCNRLALGLKGVVPPPPMTGFAPYRFRKITPADRRFVDLIFGLSRTSKRKVIEPVV